MMNASHESDLKEVQPDFDFGQKVFEWRAYDYFPHKRGKAWLGIFCAIVFGSAFALFFFGDSGVSNSLWTNMQAGNILMAFTLFLAVGVYFYTHKEGDREHNIEVYEKVLFIDGNPTLMNELNGFWFVYEPEVAILNLEKKTKKSQKISTISLQMGDYEPEFFQENFGKMGFPELIDRKESLLNTWIRILKL